MITTNQDSNTMSNTNNSINEQNDIYIGFIKDHPPFFLIKGVIELIILHKALHKNKK